MAKKDSGVDVKVWSPRNPTGLIGRLRSWMDQRNIRLVPSEQQNELDDLISILNEHPEDLDITWSDEKIEKHQPVEINMNTFVRLAVSVQENSFSAQSFMTELRASSGRLIQEQIPGRNLEGVPVDYEGTKWWAAPDVIAMADRWQIPLIGIARDQAHWYLALKSPEQHNGGEYRVLVYDPLQGGETWLDLPGWDGSNSLINRHQNNFFGNELGYEQLLSGEYDLSLFGDVEFANDQAMVSAKMTRVQFDAHNCGPSILFMAALREGAKPGWNSFKFSGRERLRDDTGLQVYIREEMLGE